MTREEKEHTGKYILELAKLLEDGCYQQEIFLSAVHIIDEALEQESILDKVREEIETKYGQCKLTEYNMQYNRLDINNIGDIADILHIIDKYKAESEDNNVQTM